MDLIRQWRAHDGTHRARVGEVEVAALRTRFGALRAAWRWFRLLTGAPVGLRKPVTRGDFYRYN